MIEARDLICKFFSLSKVYRIGGDEFAVILESEDYQRRGKLVKDFNHLMEKNIQDNNGVLIAIGLAGYDESIDTSYQSVFERADKAMYQRKDELKNMKKSTIIK